MLDVVNFGFGAFAFARRAAQVTALDWRAELLEVARRERDRRKLKDVTFVEAKPDALPFPEGSFDIVASAAAVHHFTNAGSALSEMARVCNDGGRVVIEDVVTSEQGIRRYHNRLEYATALTSACGLSKLVRSSGRPASPFFASSPGYRE
jgi:ubiquinone/menaquinone biosynthesis C-methylase UbiE